MTELKPSSQKSGGALAKQLPPVTVAGAQAKPEIAAGSSAAVGPAADAGAMSGMKRQWLQQGATHSTANNSVNKTQYEDTM